MPIVQHYKSQLRVGASELWPITPNSANLSWPKNWDVPDIAGNYWAINYVEGAQQPMLSVGIPLLNADTAKCPIHPPILNAHFITRSNDYEHDLANIPGMALFDGFSGYGFSLAKGNSFTISGAKGDQVRFSANYMLFGVPTAISAPFDNTYPYFQGEPINFKSLCFKKNGVALDGVLNFSVTYSNSSTPDMSMSGICPQSVLPVDVNAGIARGSAQFAFQANAVAHISTGDDIEIQIDSGVIATSIKLNNVLVNNPNDRGVGFGRQLRTYSLTLLGDSNIVGPITVTALP
jgi:hypothetical protein